MNLSNYAYMWDGAESGWCLIELGPQQSGTGMRYHIYNVETKAGALIESEVMKASVVRQLLATGAQILTTTELRERLRNKQ